MRFGLTDETVAKINSTLDRFPQVDRAVLYGSRAKGNYRNGSDIDLVLEGSGLTVEIINKIRHAIDDLLLPYTIDLSIRAHIKNPDLIEHIQRVGEVFYSKH